MNIAAIRLGRRPVEQKCEQKPVAEPASPRSQARQKLYQDIGDFLFIHDLDVNDRNFGVVHAYFSGDRRIVDRIEALLRAGSKLTDAMLSTLIDEEPNALTPEKLAGMADQLNEKLMECLRIVSQSSSSARVYGDSLNDELQGFENDPMGTFERLLTRTRDVVDATLDMENQLEKARRETQRLRSNLMRARREADHDHLTGLPNRRNFEMRLAALPQEPATASRSCIALCDIDRFKRINDEHGHDTGDRVLRYFARRLRDALQGKAVVARYGGEEFVCLFNAASTDEAVGWLDAIRENLEAKPLFDRRTDRPLPPLTFSAGIAPIKGDPRAALLAADGALYEAKRAGRNRLHVRSP